MSPSQQKSRSKWAVDISTINGLINSGGAAKANTNNAPISEPVQRVETKTEEAKRIRRNNDSEKT